MMFALICVVVFVGAFSQRLAGMGFALVSAPFLVLLLDPQSGVILVNVCGVVSSLVVFMRTWRHVEWKNCTLLLVMAVVGCAPGALLASKVPQAPLEACIGAIVIMSLAASIVLSVYTQPVVRTPGRTMLAGFLAGAMGASAGVSGPPLSAYAVLSRWSQQGFAATIQPVFAVSSASAVVAKLTIGSADFPALNWWEWALIFGALGLGQLAGDVGTHHVSTQVARRMMLTLAFAGGVLAFLKGMTGVVAG